MKTEPAPHADTFRATLTDAPILSAARQPEYHHVVSYNDGAAYDGENNVTAILFCNLTQETRAPPHIAEQALV